MGLRIQRISGRHRDPAAPYLLIGERLLILKTGSDVLRLAPPLVIDDTELAEGVALLFTVIKEKLG